MEPWLTSTPNPNETLRQIREIIHDDDVGFRADMMTNLESLFNTLDEWLSRGGSLPDDWESEHR